MTVTELDSLPLAHSWPLFEALSRLTLRPLIALGAGMRGQKIAWDIPAAHPGAAPLGLWSCNLRDNRLSWSPAVYALFGLSETEPLTRDVAVACYPDGARRAMEQLRAHAIGHRRGFTLDTVIRRPDGEERWMRLSALPMLCEGKVVGLSGTKQDVTEAYDGPGWRGF